MFDNEIQMYINFWLNNQENINVCWILEVKYPIHSS